MSYRPDRIENRILSEIAGLEIERSLFGEFSPASKTPPPQLDTAMAIRQIITKHADPSFPFDPEDPKPAFASALLEKVRTLLTDENVRFYTAVGSPLDWHQGVDGFLEYRGNYVTIDLKTSTDYKDGKADYIQNVPAAGLEMGTKEFDEIVENLATRCARRFKILTRGN